MSYDINGKDLIGKEVEFWVTGKKCFKTKGIVVEYIPKPKHKTRGRMTVKKSFYLIKCKGIYKYKLHRSSFDIS